MGSAGIAVELLLASLALFVWLSVEDGLVRAFAFNVMVIGGLSTIVFNGNPLLRFDGYYVLSDVLEIPNFGNADVFAQRLLRADIVQSNDVVAAILNGHPKAMSERTLQRHFLKTSGLTYKAFTQIERAQKAMGLLQIGRPAADVAFALGFTDQAHMINSLRAIMGQTPRQIAEAAR